MTEIEEQLEQTFIPHLKTQFSLGIPVLLTGAGFSLGASNHEGQSLPSYKDLQAELWDLCFPGEEFDGSSLQDLYDHAVRQRPRETEPLLRKLLTVNPETLPSWYRNIFSLPWLRCYTLNIDDLTDAANTAFSLPRRLVPISATRSTPTATESPQRLEIVHLNGTLEDLPDDVTFSLTQFAERLARQEPHYVNFAADLLCRPVVIIGTRLDEPPLWQHVEYRRRRGGRSLRELRPRSYLVTPSLDRARKALLADLNIHWIPMTGETFTSQVLGQVREEAHIGLKRFSEARAERPSDVPLVADLAVRPGDPSEFLLGQEPIWADLQSGRAVRRSIDDDLWTAIQSSVDNDQGSLLVLTGTAGSGKSTSLMRACLQLQGNGTPVGWVDRDHMPSPRDIRVAMKQQGSPRVLAIDDADMCGSALSSLIRNLLHSGSPRIILVAIRSTKVDSVLNPPDLTQTPLQEFAMPHLTDPDIDGLIKVLDQHNRLGYLKGKSLAEQRKQFQKQAGRQLLVAMIQATSNRKFEEKAVDELTDLEEVDAKVYALVAAAHALRFGLQREEIPVASGDLTNKALNAVDQLVNRKILHRRPNGFIWARHRVIAEIIQDALQKSGQIKGVLEGLAYLAATKARPEMSRSNRPRHMLRVLLNHDYLLRVIGLDAARNLYGSLENLLHWDYHYWLQRGSAEVERGELPHAEQCLNQARSISPDDPLVQNEWAYLLFRQAIESPGSTGAQALVRDATKILEGLMSTSVGLSSYPYHVLCSQGLAWSRRGMSSQDRGRYLHSLIAILDEGIRKYPRQRDLVQLQHDLKEEYLGIAVPKSFPSR